MTAAKAEERAAIGAHVVYAAIMHEGEEELQRAPSALAYSGLAAGLSMGFSLLTQALLESHLPDAPWRSLVARFGYSIGFLIIILGRQQLFTENTLTVVLPFLRRPVPHVFRGVMKLWGVVLLSNVVGAFIFSWVVGSTSVFDQDVRSACALVAGEQFGAPWGTVVIRGIFAGWLIAMMVWLLPAAEAGRVWIIIIITYVVGLGNLNHIIAGSVDTLYLVVTGVITPVQFLWDFFLPTLIGNILGGVTLVAGLGHAQVVSGVGGPVKKEQPTG